MLKKKKGMALITVIMVLLVLSILGTALLSISVNENKFSINSERKMKAYYIARSGADAVASWIEDNANEASAIIPANPESDAYTSDDVSFGDGAFSVKIVRDLMDPTMIKIEANSILKNGGTKGKAVLTMQEIKGYYGQEIFTNAIFGSAITISGNANIIGNIEAINSINIKANKNITGTITENSGKIYPEPVFPELPMGVYSDEGISIDGEYAIPSNADLVFTTAKNQILNVVVDGLDIKNITINGEGSVFLFLKNSIKITGNININGSNKKEKGTINPNALYIFGLEGNSFEFTGNSEVNGYIYAPNSDFIMRGNVDITGAIIAGEVLFGGNSGVYYIAPDEIISNNVSTYLGTSYKRLYWSGN